MLLSFRIVVIDFPSIGLTRGIAYSSLSFNPISVGDNPSSANFTISSTISFGF
jgi:hypothetical protein